MDSTKLKKPEPYLMWELTRNGTLEEWWELQSAYMIQEFTNRILENTKQEERDWLKAVLAD